MDLARWQTFSLREQIGHITSEISRARIWEEKKDFNLRNRSLERALELLDLTLSCCERNQRRELARFREIVSGCFAQSNAYDIALSDLEQFGLEHVV